MPRLGKPWTLFFVSSLPWDCPEVLSATVFCLSFYSQCSSRICPVSSGKNEACYSHSGFQPRETAGNFWFLLLCSDRAWFSGFCPLAKITNVSREDAVTEGQLTSLNCLQNLDPCNPLRCLYTKDFLKKWCGFLLQILSAISGSLSILQAEKPVWGKSSRYTNKTRKKPEQINYDNSHEQRNI